MRTQVVDEDGAARIHEASLALLEDPGIKLEHEAVYELLLEGGASPGADAEVVKIPRRMVAECLELAPREVGLANRSGTVTTLTATSEPVYWTCPGMSIQCAGVNRDLSSDDMAAMSRLAERLPNVGGVFGSSLKEVPPAARGVVSLRVMAENCSKHIRALSFTPEGAELMAEMKDVIGPHPWFSVGFTAHGPLRWTRLALEIYRRTAGHGIPATINGEPMAGASGPVTLAGSAAVGNAEILAGIVVNQLLEPGRPVIHNLGLAHVFDMRTTVAVTGGPENALLAGIAAAMGRFYGLPSCSWVSTESMCPDEQAALEKMMGFHAHAAAGCSLTWGVGQLESEMTFSPAQAVIDDEIISYARRYARGVDVTDESLAVDVTREVGIAGTFLDTVHTAENFRSELFMPGLLCRERRAQWEAAGGKRLDERAEERAAELMAAPADEPLGDDERRALRALTSDFVKKL